MCLHRLYIARVAVNGLFFSTLSAASAFCVILRQAKRMCEVASLEDQEDNDVIEYNWRRSQTSEKAPNGRRGE